MKVRKVIIALILSFLLFSNTSAHCLKEIEITARAQIAITQCELLKISNKVILDVFQIPSVPANGEMPKSGEEIEKEENEIEILAKLLFCEAGATSWEMSGLRLFRYSKFIRIYWTFNLGYCA